MKLSQKPLARQRLKQLFLIQSPRALFMDWTREIHFLHIGKCAGSQVRSAIAKLNEELTTPIRAHGHSVKLHHLPGKPRYFFAIRKPEARFVSAFYSRKNKGLPLRYHPWLGPETTAFGNFDHATDLAEALFEPGERGANAIQAIKSIHHMSDDQIDWFTQRADFFGTYPPLAILRQEHLRADMQALLAVLGVERSVDTLFSTEDRARNTTEMLEKKPLSDKARRNLSRWYAQDEAFYGLCEDWIATRQRIPAPSPASGQA